ncbi:hypothetical protein CEUSTIGMA_g12702.t1, partial [Chlamydomonas eustigma]
MPIVAGESTSMWQQMVSSGAISDTLYLCMGDGGDVASSAAAQAGVIIFGSSTSVAVTGSSAGGNAVTVTMYDSSDMVKSNGQLLLFPPAMWISLSSLNLVSAGKGSVTSLPMSTSNYYLLDTGTSLIYLVQDAYTSFKASFCPSVTALSTSSLHIACQVTSSGYFLVQITGVSSILSKTELNSLFPNISFGITGANGPVNIRPSAYMILEQYRLGSSNTNSNFLEYLVGIASAGSGSNQGILGNAWMVDLLIQETLSTRQLVITEVNSCNDISYGSSPATVASPPPTESPSPLPPSPPHSPPPPTLLLPNFSTSSTHYDHQFSHYF